MERAMSVRRLITQHTGSSARETCCTHSHTTTRRRTRTWSRAAIPCGGSVVSRVGGIRIAESSVYRGCQLFTPTVVWPTAGLRGPAAARPPLAGAARTRHG
eukprot:2674739-Prymnesium_polylepis.1